MRTQATSKTTWSASGNRSANDARIQALFVELRRKRDPMYAQPATLARAA
jgi:hypothetical protein